MLANKQGKKQKKLEKQASSESVIEEEANVYVAVLCKRLRTLKKRISKIEKYKEDIKLNKDLNQDQLLAVKKEDEVVTLISELEDLIKQLREKDAEETKEMKKQKYLEGVEQEKRLKEVKEKTEENAQQKLIALFRYFVGLNSIFPLLPSNSVPAPQKDAFFNLFHVLIGLNVDPTIAETAPLNAIQVVEKLAAASEEDVIPGVSFKTVTDTVDQLFDLLKQPPQEPEPVQEEIIPEPQESVHFDPAIISIGQQPPSLSFMTSSSLEQETGFATPESVQEAQLIDPLQNVNLEDQTKTEFKQQNNRKQGSGFRGRGGYNRGGNQRGGKFFHQGRGGFRGGRGRPVSTHVYVAQKQAAAAAAAAAANAQE